MFKLVFLKEQLPSRSFSTQSGEVLVIDLLVSDGLNNFIVSFFDKQALELQQHPLAKGASYAIEMSFDVSKGNNNGYFQKVRGLGIKAYAYK